MTDEKKCRCWGCPCGEADIRAAIANAKHHEDMRDAQVKKNERLLAELEPLRAVAAAARLLRKERCDSHAIELMDFEVWDRLDAALDALDASEPVTTSAQGRKDDAG